MPANLIRYLALFIVLLLLTTGSLGYHAVTAWLAEKKSALNTIAQGMQKRIDAYRFFTYQIYGNLNDASSDALVNGEKDVNAITLLPDVFYVEKNGKKTDALVFGQYDQSTLSAVRKTSRYLDILWGAESDVYSMYYLNGVDNSLTMISTQTLKDISSQFRGGYITAIAEARRAEMLQQATTLDERESISPIRKLRFYNDYYFTLRTTFNQPGHLATIIAFDLPINDLVPNNMPRENFILRQDSASGSLDSAVNDDDPITVQLAGSLLEIAAPLINAPVNVIYRLPLNQLSAELLRNNIWLLLLNLGLLIMTVSAFYLLRQPASRPREDVSHRLKKQQMFYHEIINHIPLGILIYDFGNNRVIVQNALAEHLSPHLSLANIAAMAEEHQGVVQATINNEMYEIRQFRQSQSPDYSLFLMREQDKEILLAKKLQRAQNEYEKNVLARQRLFQNLSNEFRQPLLSLHRHALELQAAPDSEEQRRLTQQIAQEATGAMGRLEDIALQAQWENPDWAPADELFSPLAVLDELLLSRLPGMNQKGLQLFHHYRLDPRRRYYGDGAMLKKAVSLLLDYAITNTDYGKITLTVENARQPDSIEIRISDTGTRISAAELGNLRHPYLAPTQSDRFSQNSGLALFLCDQLSHKLGGELDVNSKPDLGTHYQLTIKLAPETPHEEQEEPLLEGMNILLDITSGDIQHIVSHLLAGWGADCLVADERQSHQDCDLLITDDAGKMIDDAILLDGSATSFTVLSSPRRLRTNYNISRLLLDALLKLIEQQLETPASSAEEQEHDSHYYAAQLTSSDYYSLFIETVPEDIKRLYTEAEDGDFLSLAQTAHRLKGVFAMLNLHPGKQLCEQLERHITAQDSVQIKNGLHDIDGFVRALLQQGSQ